MEVDVKSMNFLNMIKKSYFSPGYLQPSTNIFGKFDIVYFLTTSVKVLNMEGATQIER